MKKSKKLNKYIDKLSNIEKSFSDSINQARFEADCDLKRLFNKFFEEYQTAKAISISLENEEKDWGIKKLIFIELKVNEHMVSKIAKSQCNEDTFKKMCDPIILSENAESCFASLQNMSKDEEEMVKEFLLIEAALRKNHIFLLQFTKHEESFISVARNEIKICCL